MGDLPVISRESLMALDKERLVNIIMFQAEQLLILKKRINELETRLNANSSNSSKPPSSDSPFAKSARKVSGKKGKPGAKKGHKGARQQLLEPTETKPLHPDKCSCGNSNFVEAKPYYTHQHIELPEVRMKITHFVLYRGDCTCCGKTNRALIPPEFRNGYGPRLSAVIGV
ncbi:MAG: DUF6444 domain-containing protein [Pedobacter sp.]